MTRKHACVVLVLCAICLTAAAPRVRSLDVSANGSQIVLLWRSSSGQTVGAVVSVADGAVQPLPQGEGATTAKWSPDGRRLVVVTEQSGQSTLRLYSAAGGNSRALGGNLQAPVAWREDGQRVAAVHAEPGKRPEILWYSLADNGVTLRAEVPVLPAANRPMVWLPGSDDVAFVGTDGNVYLVEAGEAKRVTTSNDVIGLALAKGGRELLWARKGPNYRYILLSLYAYDLKSRSVRRLAFPNRVTAINPDPRHAPTALDSVIFSPAGAHIAVVVRETPAPAKRPGAIAPPAALSALYLVRMSGGESVARMTSPATGDAPAHSAAFSADGKVLAVETTSRTAKSLSLIDTSAGTIRAQARVAAP